MKITAVLITKNKEYPPEIKLGNFFDEVLVTTECPSVYRRYEQAQRAKNSVIYVQDDDCIVDYEELWNHFHGEHLTNAITAHHQKVYKNTGITLVGWGCFFPKHLVDFSRYTDKYGVDDLLLSQADRVFTYLNQPHVSVISDVKHLPTATAASRMHTQPDHLDNLRKIRERLAEL